MEISERELRVEIVAAAVAKGIKPRLAVEIAEHIGERLNAVPEAFAPISKAERNVRIKAAFTGGNHDEVCAEFRISRRTLYRVIGRER